MRKNTKTNNQQEKTDNNFKHYDRKIIHTRVSRLLTITKIIPEHWLYVRLIPLLCDDETVIIRIDKLLEANKFAQTKKADKGSE